MVKSPIPRTMKWIAYALIALPPVALVTQCTAEFFSVDACLDAGNVYDYTAGLCRSDVEHLPNRPYMERLSPWVLLLCAASLIIGLLLLSRAKRGTSDRGHSPPP
jgi:hypothetical protein